MSLGPNGHLPVSPRVLFVHLMPLKHPSGPVKFSVMLEDKVPLSPGFPDNLPLGRESFHTTTSLTLMSIEGTSPALHAIGWSIWGSRSGVIVKDLTAGPSCTLTC